MPFGSSARFKCVHDGELNGVGAARELSRLQPSDAVLGADAAAETLDQIEHRQFERRSAGKLHGVRARLPAHVEMQVAVARVPVGDDVPFGGEAAAPAPSLPR